MPDEPGTKFGPYEIVSQIGRGGMGEVHRAQDTRLNREVAIKFSSGRFSERFQREARAVAALNHPNICTLFDAGPDYLVMELIEGETPWPVQLGERGDSPALSWSPTGPRLSKRSRALHKQPVG